MSLKVYARLVKKEILKEDVFKFSVEAKDIVEIAKPGQFIEIRVNDDIEPFLRRPISIYNLDKENGILEFIFQVKGKGTTILSRKKEGDLIDIIGPLGNGCFKFDKYKKIAIIGGGIGVFPLYELAKEAKIAGKNASVYLGFRSKDFVLLENEFKSVSNKLIVSTDDGSYGENGFAINFLKKDFGKENFDVIYACGPLPMLKSVQEYAKGNNIPCQISLEERMGCGLGVCLGCAVKKAESDEYFHVCKGGPVFDATKVDI